MSIEYSAVWFGNFTLFPLYYNVSSVVLKDGFVSSGDRKWDRIS